MYPGPSVSQPILPLYSLTIVLLSWAFSPIGSGFFCTHNNISPFFFQPSGACSAQLDLPSPFLSPDLPPNPPSSAPSSGLGPDLKQKPVLPYTFPGKWLSPEPYGSFCPTLPPLSNTPILGQDLACPTPSLPCSKFHYPPSTLHSTPCFPHNMPVPGYSVDLPSGYHTPFGTLHVQAGMASSPMFGTTRGQPQSGSNRPKVKVISSKNKRSMGLPTPPAAPNPCLTQLLTTGRWGKKGGKERGKGFFMGARVGVKGETSGRQPHTLKASLLDGCPEFQVITQQGLPKAGCSLACVLSAIKSLLTYGNCIEFITSKTSYC